MSATITLRHREGPVAARDNDTVRTIAEAVAAYNRNRVDNRLFRIRRSANLAVRFRASDIVAVNAHGIDLVDVNPFEQGKAVAA
jgi:hypothetical protein